MKRRRRNLSDDHPTISQHITRSKTSIDGVQTSLPIPIDLILEIFSRLPPKSIAKCRCVSKPWASILRRPDFTELFLTKSSTRPLLLFSCVKHYDELSLFSAPQIQNPNENSSIVATNYHTKFPVDYYPSEIYGSVHGLVYLNQLRIFNGKKVTMPVIYNPSTGQSLLLPRLKTARTSVMSFFGYDPIGKQYKVLSLTWPTFRRNRISEKHRVLTLRGTKKHSSWRMVKCFPHDPAYHGICINGVLYYVAFVDGPMRCCAVASFDLSSEKYRFIHIDEDMVLWSYATLVNYNGKLGVLLTGGFGELTKESTCFELWVLVDAQKHEWSKHVYALPDSWKSYFDGEDNLYFVGLTFTNEVVMSPRYLSDPFYVFYYSLERKTIKRVEIQEMDAFKDSHVHIFLNHVEDVKLMHTF